MKILFVLVILFFTISITDAQWKRVGNMKDPRAAFTVGRIDNKVYLIGGRNTTSALSSCESFDLKTLGFQSIAPMQEARLVTPCVILPDKTIYIPSGLSNLSNLMTNSCEIYNPLTDKWSYTTSLIEAREAETTLLLNDSIVLIAAGALAPNGPYRKTCELFNLNTKQVKFTGSVTTGQFGPVMFLDSLNHKVTFISDHFNGQHGTWLKETEEYDINTGLWSLVASSQVSHGVGSMQAVQLPSGEIIAPSGSNDPGSGDYAATDLIEIYTPTTHSWRTLGKVRIPRFGATSAYIGGDSVLVIGGYGPYVGSALDDCEIINLKTGAVTPGPILNDARMSHQLIVTNENDIENPCNEIFKVYVFGGESTTFTGSLKSCEMIEFRRMKPTILTAPSTLSLLGNECSGFDTLVWMKNQGCRDILIDSITVSGITGTTISLTKQLVTSADSTSLSVTNNGSPLGNSNGEVTIYYTVNGQLASQTIYISTSISGQGARLSAPASVSLTGTVCSGIDTTITLINRSCKEMVLDSLSVLGIGANISGVVIPTTLAPGDTISYSVSIGSEFPGTMSGEILIYSHTVDTLLATRTLVNTLFSASIKGKIRSIITDRFDVGDSVIVPIYLNSNNGETVDGFTLTLEYNTDLLEPYSPDFANTLVQGTGLYDQNATMTGLTLYVPTPFSISTSKPLINLRFKTYVTDTNCTVIKLIKMTLSPDNPAANYCLYQITSDSAVICLEKNCGDDLLRSQLRQTQLELSVSTGIGNESIIVKHNSVENGIITLYDVLGRKVYSHNVTGSVTNTTIDTSRLTSGLYTVTLSSMIGRVQTRIALTR